jgi:hypothetical protein
MSLPSASSLNVKRAYLFSLFCGEARNRSSANANIRPESLSTISFTDLNKALQAATGVYPSPPDFVGLSLRFSARKS